VEPLQRQLVNSLRLPPTDAAFKTPMGLRRCG
jgi:hypothetical protein